MAMKITTEVTITEIHEHLTADGRTEGYASFEGASGDIKKITGTLPISTFGGHHLIHIGQVWHVQFDYAADQQQADEE